MGTYKIIISKRARCDLQAILGFYEENNPAFGLSLTKRLVSKSYTLSKIPDRGAIFDRQRKLRYLLERPYQIIYHVSAANKIVDIYRFWHAGQDRTRFSLREEPPVWAVKKNLPPADRPQSHAIQ